jgi:hypothetical protein
LKRLLLYVGSGLSAVLLVSGCTLVASYPMTTISLGTWGATGKTPVDHAVSGVAEEDCEWMRIFSSKPICQPKPPKPVVSESQPVILESQR